GSGCHSALRFRTGHNHPRSASGHSANRREHPPHRRRPRPRFCRRRSRRHQPPSGHLGRRLPRPHVLTNRTGGILMATMTGPALPSAQGNSLRWLITDTLVFARRNLEHVRQLPEKLIEVTIQPLMFVALFAYVFGGAIAIPGGNYHEYLLAGILVQSLAFGLMGPAVSIANDLREGVIDRFLSLPTARVSYLFGHVTAEIMSVCIAMTVLSLTGLVIGWRTHTGVLDVVAAYALLLMFAAAMIWVGTLIGLFVRTPDAVAGVVFTLVFPLTFLSNAFVPISSL